MTSALGAVVVTYNSATTIEACMASLKRSGVTQIVVVDNHSTDDSVARVQRRGVRVLCNPDNKGFGEACNQGVGALAAQYLVFLNPDAVVAANAVHAAVAYLKENKNVGVVGMHVQNKQGITETFNYGNEPALYELFARKIRKSDPAHSPLVCDWVSGAALVIRRDAFESVGGFDTQYFLYWEDVDLCHRLRQKGWQVVWLPYAVVTHQRGVSLADWAQKTAMYDASADKYFRTHYATWIWVFQKVLRKLFRLVSPSGR